jgi:hypothetical protein
MTARRIDNLGEVSSGSLLFIPYIHSLALSRTIVPESVHIWPHHWLVGELERLVRESQVMALLEKFFKVRS